MKKNRIIVIADEGEVLWESLVLPEQQTEIYQAKNIQDALSHLTVFSYHLILIAVKQEPEIICQLVETIRKMVITPVIVLLPDHSEMRNKIIQAGADVVLTQLCTEEISLQAYALIRRYTEWKSERKEEVPVIVGKLEILPLQRTVEWEHKRIHVVKREFDFLYLLASTPGRVYTYSQIYQLVWQEYPHGDIANIIYCMVHRLKRKLKKVDVSAKHTSPYSVNSAIGNINFSISIFYSSYKKSPANYAGPSVLVKNQSSVCFFIHDFFRYCHRHICVTKFFILIQIRITI